MALAAHMHHGHIKVYVCRNIHVYIIIEENIITTTIIIKNKNNIVDVTYVCICTAYMHKQIIKHIYMYILWVLVAGWRVNKVAVLQINHSKECAFRRIILKQMEYILDVDFSNSLCDNCPW